MQARSTVMSAVLSLAVCTAGALVALPSAASANTASPAGSGPSVAVQATEGSVVVVVDVPVADVPTYVSRRYSYDLYGTCWSKKGRPRLDLEQRIGSATVPFSPGTHQLRLPGDVRTSFRFVDQGEMLAHPPVVLQPLQCPKHYVAGAYRAHVEAYSVSISSVDGEQVLTGAAGVDHWFAAPGHAQQVTQRRR